MLRYTALLALLIATQLSHAGVVSRDLFEPGDGLLTYDDVNHREWLDFSVTEGLTYAEVVDLLGHGQKLNRFLIATRSDVELLYAPDDGSSPSPTLRQTQRRLEDWIHLLGFVGELEVFYREPWRYTGGLVVNRIDGNQFIESAMLLLELPAITGGLMDIPRRYFPSLQLTLSDIPSLPPSYSLSPFDSTYWLYRDAAPVPEPTTACLVVAACLTALRLRVLA